MAGSCIMLYFFLISLFRQAALGFIKHISGIVLVSEGDSFLLWSLHWIFNSIILYFAVTL